MRSAMRPMIQRVWVIATACALLAVTPLSAQQAEPVSSVLDTPGAYRVFTGGGEEASIEDLVAAAREAEVVLLGETHGDRVGHALELEIFARILHGDSMVSDRAPTGSERGQPASTAVPSEPGDSGTIARDLPRRPQIPRRVVLSLEMFERDVQYILDEYLAGLISEDHFLKSGRPWAHYRENYRPLVELARTEGIRVLAANAPRRYVDRVAREGPDALHALSEEAKRSLPPLPYSPPSEAYRAEFLDAMRAHGGGHAADSPANRFALFAQALWDATMAYTVAEELLRRPESLVVHLVGAFHVRNGTGLPEHLARYRPGTRTLMVILEPVEDTSSFPRRLIDAGDFVVLTDESP